jgi:CTD small phosphatase-like protein 2
MTVVFDLDETLVHCFEELSEKHQVEIAISFPGGSAMKAPVNIRPHTVEVLKELAKEFELIIFTASHEAYANAVINYLDPKKEIIQHRLFRRHCDYIDEGYYVKDLRILGRDLAKTVIVDNAAYSYAFQVANGIPIISYY